MYFSCESDLSEQSKRGKTRNSLTEKIFREINSSILLVKPLLSRNFWQKSEREREFPQFPNEGLNC